MTQPGALQALPSRLRKSLLGDLRADLLNKVTDHLLVFGNELLHLESGKRINLANTNAAGEESGDAISAASIANAAAATITGNLSERSILLLLPPSEFIATNHSMPGMTAENLQSALLLQRDTLLPAFDAELSMAVEPAPADDDNEQVAALWFSQARLDELFGAFAENGLNLTAVQPRILRAIDTTTSGSIIEEDETSLTAINTQDGVIRQWHQLPKADLQQQEFAEQWQAVKNSLGQVSEIDSAAYENKSIVKATPAYCFYPKGALAARARVEKGKQFMIAASLLAGLLFLAAIPFLFQSFELRMAEGRLADTREMSADARADQSVVVSFENQWGTINDFPDQQLRQAMFQLQEVLGSERLSSLELNEGLIRIQGTSADPQAILQRLEQDPMFTEVVFSRATNNSRYYIDLRLATVSFEAYLVRYFPDES